MAMQLIDRQVLYTGRKISLELRHYQPPEGGRRHTREVVVHPGAVVILPILDDQHILLIRTRRYAVEESLLELPAGTLEKGELPINCAGRELLEETGYLAQRLAPLGSFYASPGVLSERLYAFAAYDLQRHRQMLEEGEEIEVSAVLLDEAVDMIRSGAIADGKTIATILSYVMFHRDKGVMKTNEAPDSERIGLVDERK